MVLLVNPSFPAKTLAEFIAYAKANPGKINFASPGVGTPMHVAIELLKMQAGIDVVHVPYRGPAPAITDLLAGQVQAFIITLSTAIGFIRGGKLRGLAVTGEKRAEILPDVAEVSEVLPGFDATAWDGIWAPKGTPPRCHRHAQREYHRRACRSAAHGASSRIWAARRADGCRRVRQIRGCRNRKMGQGGEVRQYPRELN